MSTPTPVRESGGIGLVAEREITSKLRSKPFLISTGILLIIALAGVLFAGFTAGDTESTPVAVTGESVAAVSALPDLEITEVATRAEAEDLVRAGDVDAAVVASDSPLGLAVIALDSPPNSLIAALALKPEVVVLEPSDTDPLLRYFTAIGFGIVFLLAATTFGTTIAQSVVEEKQTRVVELLISTISARALLAGKVIGNTVLAMGQIVALAAVVIVGLMVTGQNGLLQILGGPIIWFAVFFLFGFVLLASLFAAAASMVSRQEDIGSTTTPITMLVMAPYFLVIFFNDNPVVLTVLSYVPFSAPVGMPIRLFVGEASWWEPLLSLLIVLLSCVIAIRVAAKIYENSLLRMGGRVKLGEALKG